MIGFPQRLHVKVIVDSSELANTLNLQKSEPSMIPSAPHSRHFMSGVGFANLFTGPP
jgi:hypothetical protein